MTNERPRYESYGFARYGFRVFKLIDIGGSGVKVTECLECGARLKKHEHDICDRCDELEGTPRRCRECTSDLLMHERPAGICELCDARIGDSNANFTG